MDPFAKLLPGQSLPGIPSKAWNAFLDGVKGPPPNQGGRLGGLGDGGNLILIRNNSGSDVDRFGVLSITSPEIDPSDNEAEYLQNYPMGADTPGDDDDLIVILQEPIASGEMGTALVSGVTPVRLSGTNSGDFAASVSGQTGYLRPNTAGAALILWSSLTSGTSWALVKLGNPSSPGVSFNTIINILDTWPGEMCYKAVEAVGANLLTDLTTTGGADTTFFTGFGDGSDAIAVNLYELDADTPGHDLDTSGGFNTRFPALKVGVGVEGKTIYVFWGAQPRPGCT